MNMALLHRKIINSFEQKLVNLRGLRGLKIKEIRKFGKRGSVTAQAKNELLSSTTFEN
jgi:hypothetical protein